MSYFIVLCFLVPNLYCAFYIYSTSRFRPATRALGLSCGTAALSTGRISFHHDPFACIWSFNPYNTYILFPIMQMRKPCSRELTCPRSHKLVHS